MKVQILVLALLAYIASVSAWTFKFCTGERLTGKCLTAHSNIDKGGCAKMKSPLAGNVHSFSYKGSLRISLFDGNVRVGSSVGDWSVGAVSKKGSKMDHYCVL